MTEIGENRQERCMRYFTQLLEAGVFDLRNGSATLDFDTEGTLMQIRLNTLAYKKQKGMI